MTGHSTMGVRAYLSVSLLWEKMVETNRTTKDDCKINISGSVQQGGGLLQGS